jgi:hypothetical protein
LGVDCRHNNNNTSSSSRPAITISKRSPLYFQHEGHSQTVFGIQQKQIATELCSSSNSKEEFFLILDPAERTQDIVRCL